ncbi:MAG: toxin co-regulated pilus biosynthesis Q family protein [Alphaproteobacteria bacterium]|nr:toxin co-regulated pilus biosynthesis Q family protein [Alphaproteobacteria bacterium]
MKQQLLKNTIIAGVMTCAFGVVSACVPWENTEEAVLVSEQSTAKATQAVCTAENQGNCIVTYEEPDLNLAQAYSGYAVSTNASYQAGAVPMALSAPASQNGMSVKERMRQKELAQQRADLALQPVQSGDIICAGADCANALFKTEIEKTIHTKMIEEGQSNSVYVAAQTGSVAQKVPAHQNNVSAVIAEGTTMAPAVNVAQSGNIQTNVLSDEKAVSTVTAGTVENKEDAVSEKTETKMTSLKAKIAFGEEVHDWEAPAGETLRTLLMQWGEASGWTVVWKMDRDYNLEAGVVFRGKFTEVAAAFIRSFARATPAPIGTFYKGNRVLVINTQENDNAD